MRRHAGILIVVSCLAGLLPAAAQAEEHVPTAELLGAVNATRAAAGIPPVVIDERMSQGCREWVDYLHQNGGFATEFHDETPGRPGYTELGRQAAQRANGGFSLRTPERPLFSAPGHRVGFLHPVPLKAGLAERRIGEQSYSCQWYSLYEDAELQPARRAPAQPRAYTVPADGSTGAWTFERASEGPSVPAFDVGFAERPDSLYLAGMHVFLYHDDLPGTRMENACRAVLLGPGDRPVTAPLLRGAMLVPKDPSLPGGRYRVLATYAPARTCTTPQRSSATSFTTRPRPPVTDLLRLGDPYQRDGRWYADTYIDELLRVGGGMIRKDFDNVHGRYQYDLDGWWKGGRPPEALSDDFDGTVTYTLRNELVRIGPACWSPTTVRRTYTKTPEGVTAGPVSVDRTMPDLCEAPPAPSAPVPAAGSPGAVVRITGPGVAEATAVSFGGAAATSWEPAGGGIAVTVPAGARSGPVLVTTPTGAGTATATFRVPAADGAPPQTRILLAPTGAGESGTVHIAFSGTEGAERFRCRVDTGAWSPCRSPLVREGLRPGVHTVRVAATDRAGNTDQTPAAVAWRVGPGAAPAQPAARRDPSLAGPARLNTSRATLSATSGRLALGTLTVRVRSRVRVTLAVTSGGRPIVVAPIARTLPAGRSVGLVARIGRRSRAVLRRGARLQVRATITVRPLRGGSVARLQRTISVRAR